MIVRLVVGIGIVSIVVVRDWGFFWGFGCGVVFVVGSWGWSWCWVGLILGFIYGYWFIFVDWK